MISKTTLEKAKEAILFYQRRCNEQGFYTPNKQDVVTEALEAINQELNSKWQEPSPQEVYDLIRSGAADGGWQGFATRISNFLKKKNNG